MDILSTSRDLALHVFVSSLLISRNWVYLDVRTRQDFVCLLAFVLLYALFIVLFPLFYVIHEFTIVLTSRKSQEIVLKTLAVRT